MSKDSQKHIFSGVVAKPLPDTTFQVTLENGQQVLAYLSGRMRLNYIRIVPGDKVRVEIDANDSTKGRIIYREK
ncbi:MAG: translation initiation factor IF-1 [Candidatus Shapirobacteria bacterium]